MASTGPVRTWMASCAALPPYTPETSAAAIAPQAVQSERPFRGKWRIMSTPRICLLVAAAAAGAFVIASSTAHAQAVPGNWQETWADEFNQGANTPNPTGPASYPDLVPFTFATGGGGYGNGEWENYTTSPQNVYVATDPNTGIGALNIVAQYDGTNYTSARMYSLAPTYGFSQTYGLFEWRAKFPAGQGLWPALWMMSVNQSYGGWPYSGEIDVFESQGQNTSLVQGTTHTANNNGQYLAGGAGVTTIFANTGLEPPGFTTTDWHTYDLEWDPPTGNSGGDLKWYIDGVLYATQYPTNWAIPTGALNPMAPFDQPFYIIMNMAIGGGYVGNASLTPNTPYDMQVDYFRAYEADTGGALAIAPEPSSLALALLGGAALLRRRRRN